MGVFGRAPVFKSGIVVSLLGGIIISINTDYYSILIGLFIIGIGAGGDQSTAATVLCEAIPFSKQRALVMINIAWNSGTALALLLAVILEIFWDLSYPSWYILV